MSSLPLVVTVTGAAVAVTDTASTSQLTHRMKSSGLYSGPRNLNAPNVVVAW